MANSQSNPRVTSSLDSVWIDKSVRASWEGTHSGQKMSDEERVYWNRKATTSDEFSDGIWRIGWNLYWEERMTGDSSPEKGDYPARFQPKDESEPESEPQETNDSATKLLKAIVDNQEKQLKAQSEQTDALRIAIQDLKSEVAKSIKIRF